MLTIILASIEAPSDKELFENIYNQYEKQMFYVANGVLRDEYLAEDACQIAFTRIAAHMDKLRNLDEKQTKSYLLISAKNAALDIVRKREKIKTIDINSLFNLQDINAIQEMESIGNENYIIQILKMLPETYTDVMYLRFVVGMSEKEIAHLLSRKINTVRQQVSRGRKMFIDLYEKEKNKQ